MLKFTTKTKKTLKDEIFEETDKINRIRFSNILDSIRKASTNGQYFVNVNVPISDIEHFKTFFMNQGFSVEKMNFHAESKHYVMRIFWNT